MPANNPYIRKKVHQQAAMRPRTIAALKHLSGGLVILQFAHVRLRFERASGIASLHEYLHAQ